MTYMDIRHYHISKKDLCTNNETETVGIVPGGSQKAKKKEIMSKV
jgi:hypothetical protein